MALDRGLLGHMTVDGARWGLSVPSRDWGQSWETSSKDRPNSVPSMEGPQPRMETAVGADLP